MKVIELTKGFVAVVDDEDFDMLAQWRWHVTAPSKGFVYAVRKDYATKKMIYMHKVITSTDRKTLIDHRNGNTLDNRRQNLRVATHQGNASNRRTPCHNKLGIKGVTFMGSEKAKPYRAQITANKHHRTLGYFKTAEEAHACYCKAATEAFGDFARFN